MIRKLVVKFRRVQVFYFFQHIGFKLQVPNTKSSRTCAQENHGGDGPICYCYNEGTIIETIQEEDD